ncbi:MAG TPA: DUF3037 domain-containing protein [Solirubrobacteraceae bacterium]|jgi:hypothetical protein|nr:DUF3037 domain-containing protein [Solirubrobacteraceae bacterium]
MPSGEPFAYAILRVIPRADRGEAINVGVVLFCRAAGFLELRWHVPIERLTALDATLDTDALGAQLRALESVARGDPAGGAVASQPPSERFHWLVAPASTIVVPSEVHTGISDDPRATLAQLFEKLVR